MNYISCKSNLINGNVNHIVDFDGHIMRLTYRTPWL